MTPLGPPMVFFWVQMVPTNHAGCVPPRSTDIRPFGATRATYGKKYLIYDIFGPFPNPPHGPLWQFWWVQMAPTDHPGCIPPRSNRDPLRSIHLEPPGPGMASYIPYMTFWTIFRPKITILWPNDPPVGSSSVSRMDKLGLKLPKNIQKSM